MANLDNTSEIKLLDLQNLSGSIEKLAKQCEQVRDEIGKLQVKDDFVGLERIMVIGMGGSTLGTHIVKSLFFDQSRVTLEYINGYHIPAYVNGDTLVILSSYSGTTEEVLAAYKEVKAKSAKIFSLSSGGSLGQLTQKGEIDGYIFEPKFNPSGQPRMGLGYSILSQILIFAKLGYLQFSDTDFDRIIKVIGRVNSVSNINIETANNSAKETALKFLGKIPFLFASEHLVGNIHTFANQINENAKVISAYFTLPEADHHLIEGLPSTDEIHKNVVFFFLNSDLYSKRVQMRYPITKALVERAHFETIEVKPQGKSKIEQSFEFLTFGSWVSFYLAMLYDRDPSPIPNVDFLKAEMKK